MVKPTGAFRGFYRGKRVLVTGHTGFKGSWLCQWLLDLGAEVSGYSLYIPSKPSHFEVLNLPKRMDHRIGDVRDLGALSAALKKSKPELIFHLAAQPIVRAAYEDPKTTYDTNLGGTVNVLEAVRKHAGVHALVLVTSDKCYENVEWEWGYRESDRLGGKDPYSASKACAEIAASSYMRSYFQDPGSTRVATARAGNVIGGGDWARDRVVPDCITAWAAAKTLLIRNPAATRPWQHVLEPLSGYLSLGAGLARGDADLAGEAFNFGPAADGARTVEDLIEGMAAIWKGSRWKKDPAGDAGKKEASLLQLNCEKSMHRLAWKPTLAFEESVRLTAEWYQTFYARPRDSAACTSDQIRLYQGLALQRGRAWAPA